MTNVTRYCDEDRTVYSNRVGVVDFAPYAGRIRIEEFGKKPITLHVSAPYVYHLHALAKEMMR